MDTQDSTLSPETFVRNWQQTGMRILRAQERMLQGVTSAAKLEMRFGQELMESRLALLKWTEQDPQSRSDHAIQEVEKILSLVRGVTEELRVSFTEATKLLADATQEAVEHSKEAAQDFTQAGVDAVRQTTARTQRNLAKAGELVKESAAKTAELSQENVARAEGMVSEDK
jgi:hypothetical protein